MAVTVFECRKLADELCRQYPAALDLGFRFRKTVAELYPDENEGSLTSFKGAYFPAPFEFNGRQLLGRIDIPTDNARDIRDAEETLRHEVLGHYGINTFATDEKDAVLDALIAARRQRGLISLWQRVDLEYPGVDIRMRAEEVYAAYCENLPEPEQANTAEIINRLGETSFRETCIDKTRPMQLHDLHRITYWVAQGLHDGSRTQQHFPKAESRQMHTDGPGTNLEYSEPDGKSPVPDMVDADRAQGSRLLTGLTGLSSTLVKNIQKHNAEQQRIELERAATMPRQASTFTEARKEADMFKGKPLTTHDRSMTAVLSRNNLDKMLSEKAATKSETHAIHALAVANVDRLFENSVPGWSHTDKKGNPNLVAVYRRLAPMRADGQIKLVKLTIKEFAEPDIENKIYSIEAVSIVDGKSPVPDMVDADRAQGSRLLTGLTELSSILVENIQKYNAEQQRIELERAATMPRQASTFTEARKEAATFKGKPLTTHDRSMTAVLSRNNLDKMLSKKAATKSETHAIHALAVANVDRLFENSVPGWSHTDKNNDPDLTAVHRRLAPMLADGQIRLVKLTIKEFFDRTEKNKIYSIEAVKVVDGKSPVPEMVVSDRAKGSRLLTGPTELSSILVKNIQKYNAEQQRIELERAATMPRQASTCTEARKEAQAFKGKPLENSDSKLTAIASRNNLDKMLSDSAVSKSTNAKEHALAVANLDHLFRNATYGWSKQDREQSRHIVAIHRLFAPMNTPAGMRIVKLTVKELEPYETADGNRIYTVEAIKIESPASIWVEANIKQEPDLNSTPYAGHTHTVLEDKRNFNHGETESPASIWVAAYLKHDSLEPTSTPYAGQVQSLIESIQKYNAEQQRIELERAATMPRQASTFTEARKEAQAFKGKPLENSDSKLTAIASRNNLDKMLSDSAVSKSTNAKEHALAVANLDHLFRNATYGWSKQDRDNDRNIPKIHRLFAPMATNGGIRLVKLTLKEYSHDTQPNKIYSVEAIRVESPASIWVNANLKQNVLESKSTPYAGHTHTVLEGKQNFKHGETESPASIWVEANIKHDGLTRGQTPYAGQVQSLIESIEKYNQATKLNEYNEPAKPDEADLGSAPVFYRRYLAVPYGEKNAAKEAGARWDKKAKAWYYDDDEKNPGKFKAWQPENRPRRHASPVNEFQNAMRSLGLDVYGDHPIANGKPQRVRADGDRRGETAGYYTFHLDGAVPAGYIKNFRTGEELHWRSQETQQLNEHERAILAAEMAAQKAGRERERLAEQEKIAARTQRAAARLMPVSAPTPYMAAKGIAVHQGVLTDADGNTTYVPAYDIDGKQWTMQSISADGNKRFVKGGRKAGCFHVVGGFETLAKRGTILIAEGYATAASISEAMNLPAVVAFDAGNLESVARSLREKFPGRPIVICADDDRHVRNKHGQAINPGWTKAKKAADAVGGIAVRPAFLPEDIAADSKAFTDFNDLAAKSALGKEAIRRQIEPAVLAAKQERIMEETMNTINQAMYPNAPEDMEKMPKEDAVAAADADIERLDTLEAAERTKELENIAARARANTHYRDEILVIAPSLLAKNEETRSQPATEQIKNLNIIDAGTLVKKDLEKLERSGEKERGRVLEEIAAKAEASHNYKTVIKNVAPILLTPQSKTAANGAVGYVLGKEPIISMSESSAANDSKNRQLSGGDDAAESLERLRRRARSEADVLENPEDTRSELLEIDDLDLRGREYNYQPGKAELEELRARTGGKATPEDSRSELLGAEAKERREKEEAELSAHSAEIETAIAEKLRITKEREQREYIAGLMDMSNPSGYELGKQEFILPRPIAQKYLDVDSKFYTRDKNPRVAFEDTGSKLKTSTTNSEVVADMVTLAKAKQWTSLKLSGEKQFRREAWLQAESQGIKTTGYTPNKTDLIALEALRQERSTNSIQPDLAHTAEQKKPSSRLRHDLNKDQARMFVSATKNVAANTSALKQNPAMASKSDEALEKLAFWRGIVQESTKYQPITVQTDALAKFDKAAENPDFLDRLEKSDSNAQENATRTREHAHKKEAAISL